MCKIIENIPRSCKEICLHRNVSNYDVIPYSKFEQLAKYQFKRNRPFKILVHGFLADCHIPIFPVDIIQGMLGSVHCLVSL